MVKGSISDRILKERKTPCNRCQETACTCVHTGIAPISPHLILPVELPNYNYIPSQIYPIEQNYMVPNPIFTIDPNFLHYHSLQTAQPSPIPILSPVSSSSPSSPTSPPSPQSSPVTRRPFRTTKKFKCPECYKSFDYKHVLQNHERIHTGVKPYVCKICEKRFTRDHHLKTHMRLHTGEKPYICEYCNMRFVQVANLRRHLKVHDPIKCTTCDKRFPDGSRLQRHLLEHDLDSRPCNICHDKCHVKSKCPLRISGKNDNDDDSDALSSGDSHTSSTGSEQSTRYETESISQVLDLRRIVMNTTQSEPEDLSMKKYFQKIP